MRAALLALAIAAPAVLAGTARGDGLPVVGVDVGASGVVGSSGVRYVALPARGDTLVALVEQRGGRVTNSKIVPGRFTIPAVAYDGSADGLSADGRTLVLIRPRATFPQRTTRLAVVDAARLTVRETIALAGDFSFDAISPSGSYVYLVEYLSPRDPTRYAVRVYDLRAGRLLPDPVVDPTEPDERMGGIPLTRAWSPDRRWAYTLYERPGDASFIHALDTSGRTARCIDLEGLAGREDLADLRLDAAPGRGTLTVRTDREAVALVNTRTFEAMQPAGPSTERRADVRDERAFPWTLAAAPLAGFGLALLAVVALRLRRRPRTAAPRGT